MSKYDKLIPILLENIGGSSNIRSANHCATRLRLKLHDKNKLNKTALEKETQILGIVEHGDEIQLVIGPDVPKVYALVTAQLDQNEQVTMPTSKQNKSFRQYAHTIVDFISGTFVPVLPVLVAAGLISAVLNIGTTFFNLSNESGTYIVLNAINHAGFYFLPVFLGYSAARKLEISPIMGMFLGAVLVDGLINNIANLSFLGFQVPQAAYNSTTIPVIFGVLFMYIIDKGADKVIPEAIKFFIKPLLVMIITVPVTLLLLGPLGNIVGSYIADVLSFMYVHLGWLSVGLMGALTPLLVMTGTNQALFPLVFAMIADNGYDSFVMPAMLAANVAIGAAALADMRFEKDLTKKSLSFSAGITGVMGITEPSIFGVLINHKHAFLGAIFGGGIGGLFAGLVGLKQYAVVSPGLAALPTFIPTDGSGFSSNFWYAVLTILLAISTSVAMTLFLGKRSTKQTKPHITIKSPLSGKIYPLETIKDELFSQKILGDGIAIMPTNGEIVSPSSGHVIMTTKTSHAIGIQTDDGVELLIHCGLDTVQLAGRYFETLVQEGEQVTAGQPLLKMDLTSIQTAGYDTITPIIVTNSADYHQIDKPNTKNVTALDPLLTISF
ncbi:glucose PTS transporter subunit IIA [Listeria ivanovii]|uniref:glucose PTS transporter subunit IIA n=1 Tax=Listeria ivanovii TaxID=1638 RepID=UPI000512805C|nr:glucose PTS transporter subunit IIA [Listeria ivanovii]AIS63940.1 PTS sugar transporter [Listeria ivanovii subsp. londoniensis]MBK1966270.1 PTS glucose transporter subunit IIA [Listeria ivanovii subsp. londoniensis]MBK1983910.1 PTS glucose transporter subunit IIA [Listeria ivanovii subsp. londoniensis]MBK1995986.1 PTS glucose transporter subunit IIA [Listeria ivanovii subsp. londoniensis]